MNTVSLIAFFLTIISTTIKANEISSFFLEKCSRKDILGYDDVVVNNRNAILNVIDSYNDDELLKSSFNNTSINNKYHNIKLRLLFSDKPFQLKLNDNCKMITEKSNWFGHIRSSSSGVKELHPGDTLPKICEIEYATLQTFVGETSFTYTYVNNDEEYYETIILQIIPCKNIVFNNNNNKRNFML